MNTDNINPEHYQSGGVETIDILRTKLSYEQYIGFLKGVILQYIIRADQKNGLEDYKKAEWYLQKLLLEVKQ